MSDASATPAIVAATTSIPSADLEYDNTALAAVAAASVAVPLAVPPFGGDTVAVAVAVPAVALRADQVRTVGTVYLSVGRPAGGRFFTPAGVTPSSRTVEVPGESRTMRVAAESRTVSVAAESRTLEVS